MTVLLIVPTCLKIYIFTSGADAPGRPGGPGGPGGPRIDSPGGPYKKYQLSSDKNKSSSATVPSDLDLLFLPVNLFLLVCHY